MCEFARFSGCGVSAGGFAEEVHLGFGYSGFAGFQVLFYAFFDDSFFEFFEDLGCFVGDFDWEASEFTNFDSVAFADATFEDFVEEDESFLRIFFCGYVEVCAFFEAVDDCD